MSKRSYCQTLELRIQNLRKQVAALKLRSERVSFVSKFRYSRDIQRLEQRAEELEARLSELRRKQDSVWEDIKANIRAVADELPPGVERWMERLDRSYAASSTSPEAGSHSIVARDRGW
jgi:predicted  nucleic acid-binding Zn-ribbon protein